MLTLIARREYNQNDVLLPNSGGYIMRWFAIKISIDLKDNCMVAMLDDTNKRS